MSPGFVNRALVLAITAVHLACGSGNAPVHSIESQVVEVTPAPATTTVGYEYDGQIVVRGAVHATCAPYSLSVSAVGVRDTLLITLIAAVAGTACPHDTLWSKGYRVTATHVPTGIRYLRILHTTDLPGETSEVLHEGPLQP